MKYHSVVLLNLPVVSEASFPYFESSIILFSSILSKDKCSTRFGSLLVIVGENVGVGCLGLSVTSGLTGAFEPGALVGFVGTEDFCKIEIRHENIGKKSMA